MCARAVAREATIDRSLRVGRCRLRVESSLLDAHLTGRWTFWFSVENDLVRCSIPATHTGACPNAHDTHTTININDTHVTAHRRARSRTNGPTHVSPLPRAPRVSRTATRSTHLSHRPHTRTHTRTHAHAALCVARLMHSPPALVLFRAYPPAITSAQIISRDTIASPIDCRRLPPPRGGQMPSSSSSSRGPSSSSVGPCRRSHAPSLLPLTWARAAPSSRAACPAACAAACTCPGRARRRWAS